MKENNTVAFKVSWSIPSTMYLKPGLITLLSWNFQEPFLCLLHQLDLSAFHLRSQLILLDWILCWVGGAAILPSATYLLCSKLPTWLECPKMNANKILDTIPLPHLTFALQEFLHNHHYVLVMEEESSYHFFTLHLMWIMLDCLVLHHTFNVDNASHSNTG